MARPLRIEYSGALYHIAARGNGRQATYLTDADRATFLKLLVRICMQYHWLCYAYCLMGNHYHVVIEMLEANMSRGMRQLYGLYTQSSNRARGGWEMLFRNDIRQQRGVPPGPYSVSAVV